MLLALAGITAALLPFQGCAFVLAEFHRVNGSSFLPVQNPQDGSPALVYIDWSPQLGFICILGEIAPPCLV